MSKRKQIMLRSYNDGGVKGAFFITTNSLPFEKAFFLIAKVIDNYKDQRSQKSISMCSEFE